LALRFGWNSVFVVVGVLGLAVALCQRLVLPALGPAATIPLRRQVALLKRPAMAGGLLVTMLWMAGYVVTYSYLTPYLIDIQHVASSWVSPLLLLFGLASLIGSRAGGGHTDRHGHHATLMASKVLQIIFLVAMALSAMVLPHPSMIAIAVVLALWSIAAWASGPAQQVRVASLDPNASGVLVGLNQSGMQLGIATGAALGGIAANTFGLAALPWLSAVMVALALALMIWLHQAKKGGQPHCVRNVHIA
jgi:DHA1 family putative efflux transporter-like MFS transporter